MRDDNRSRYRQVSRRAMLKGSLGAGTIALIPGLACGTGDDEIFAGAVADPTTTTTTPASTTAAVLEAEAGAEAENQPTASGSPAVIGELVISFTYTQVGAGKNEPPYVAVWVENATGDLVDTVSLWYEQGRRGERWLDHLTRWYDRDVAAAGSSAPTVSSATRAAGSYAVAWDGTTATDTATAGDYFVCIESAREDGPYSLIREAVSLDGSLLETLLPDNGELSAASVRIDA